MGCIGRQWSCRLPLFSTCIAVLWWGFANSQESGFVSIDCGSESIYTDSNGIEWTGDGDLMKEGTVKSANGVTNAPFNTMRLFEGNQSKYCYSLTNNMWKAGGFFLVRVSFCAGVAPPYTPQSSDDRFHFKVLIDADEWQEVSVPYGTTDYHYYEIYMRAQRSSIDVCLARSEPDGNNPFITAIELRPLPSTLSSTYLMNGINRNFRRTFRADYGTNASSFTATRYPYDPWDRMWKSYPGPPAISTVSNINTNIVDKPPARILQTAYERTINNYFPLNFTDLEANSVYVVEFYFAEIEVGVNASGQRMFDIVVNDAQGQKAVNKQPLDIFALVGRNVAYTQLALAEADQNGLILFNFSATATSIFPPFLAAAEHFLVINNSFSPGSFPSDVSAIEDLKNSINLSSSTGDPCLPVGYGYPWLKCTPISTPASTPRITSISLSNYGASGEIPKTINTLTMLDQILMDGNNLEGSIPDLSALTSLQTLDLSNNNLNGSIPDSLATLGNLKVLNLQNNNLSGEIPAALLERKQAAKLNFEFSGNPILCGSNIGVACNSSFAPPSANGHPPSYPPSSQKSKSRNMGMIIGVIVGILVISVGIGFVVFWLCKKTPSSTIEQPSNKKANAVIPKLLIQEFTFEEIRIATDNFSTLLGKGGFGPVYKGTLEDGRIVAIKVASNSSHQGSKEFLNEVHLLSRIHHKNLVGLLGYCNEENLVLVYEFMSNGSLFDCLHGQDARASPLPWSTRLRILVDAAQGFDYLHYGCNPRIIHRDVKSSNILLNDKLEAKISDFGISRNNVITESGAPPTAVMGSRGYMDPEYISTLKLTEKIDVYSFGVLLFEVVCGRTVVFTTSSQQHTHIVEWARSSIDCGSIEDIVDESLHEQYDVSSVWKVVEVALACVRLPSTRRPDMSAVYLELKEAERIELERGQRKVIKKPSRQYSGNEFDSLSLTNVSAR